MKTIRSQRGQSLVELSVSLVLLLILLAGAVEFGIAFFQFVQLQDAAQEGALYGSMNPSDCAGILDRVKGASNSPVNLTTGYAAGTVQITTKINGTACNAADATYTNAACEGSPLRVDVTYQHRVFMPFFTVAIGNTFNLHASVTDTILSPICP